MIAVKRSLPNLEEGPGISEIAAVNKNAGFSLIEIAIVVVIGGLLMTLFVDSMLVSQKKAKMEVTKERIEAVDEALRDYSLTNYELPCPASRRARVDTANYAVEANCAAAPIGAQTIRSNSAPPLYPVPSVNVRIGSVPTRTLNLPDSYGYDAWGGRLLYAVAEHNTDQTSFDLERNNTIGLHDSGGATVVVPRRSLPYLLVSHGADREGAYDINGRIPVPCNAAQLDGQNCNGDIGFVLTSLVSTSAGPNNFDDIVSYKGRGRQSEVPAGAVMAFNLSACPGGWAENTDLRGRVVIGAGPYVETSPAWTKEATTYGGETFARGVQGGSATVRGLESHTEEFKSLPPYLPLIYCEKI